MKTTRVYLGALAAGALGLSLPAWSANIDVTIDAGVRTSNTEGQCLFPVPGFTGNDCSYNKTHPFGGPAQNWIGPGYTGAFYALGTAPQEFVNPPNPATDGRLGIALSGTITINDQDTPAACSSHQISGTILMEPFSRNYQTQVGQRQVDNYPNGITQTLAAQTVSAGTANGAGGCDYVLGSGGAPNVITTGADNFPSQAEYANSTTGTTLWTAPGSAGLAPNEGNTGIAAVAAIGAGAECFSGPATACAPAQSLIWNTVAKASWDNIVGTLSTDSSGNITGGTLFLVHIVPVVGATDNSWLAYTVSLTGTGPGGPAANAVDDAASTPQDVAVVINALANDTNFTDPVTVTIATNGTKGVAVVNGSPGNQAAVSITYTPNAGETGSDTFQYTVDDGASTDTATVTVTITPVGANDDTASTRLNVPVLVNVLANDVGFDNPVTLSITLAPDAGGSAEIVDTTGTPVAGGTGNAADLRIRLTPSAALGTATYQERFSYQVSSGSAPPLSYKLTAVSQTVPFGTSPAATFNDQATAVVDGSTVTVTGVGFTSTNPNATYNYSNGNWTTTVGTGVDVVKVSESCTEGPGTSCTDVYNGFLGDWIDGLDMNGDPSPYATNSVTVAGDVLTIARQTRFFGNPLSPFFNQPATLNLEFTLEPGQGGGTVISDDAQVTVTVNNALPTAAAGAITTISTQGVNPSTVSGTFNAATGNSLGDAPATVATNTVTNGGTAVAGTTVTYTPNATFYAGTGSFNYVITDADGETATNTVTVTIADVAPTLASGSATGNQGTTLNASGAFTAGNGSVAQHALTVQTAATSGTCTPGVAGGNVTVAYVPNAGFTGPDSCVVRLADGDGDGVNATFSFTVNAAGGGGGLQLPGGSGAIDPWSLALLGALPLLRRRRRLH